MVQALVETNSYLIYFLWIIVKEVIFENLRRCGRHLHAPTRSFGSAHKCNSCSANSVFFCGTYSRFVIKKKNRRCLKSLNLLKTQAQLLFHKFVKLSNFSEYEINLYSTSFTYKYLDHTYDFPFKTKKYIEYVLNFKSI